MTITLNQYQNLKKLNETTEAKALKFIESCLKGQGYKNLCYSNQCLLLKELEVHLGMKHLELGIYLPKSTEELIETVKHVKTKI